MKKSWRTTLIGIGAGVGIVVLELIKSGTTDVKTLVTAGALALLGILSKDFKVSGGDK